MLRAANAPATAAVTRKRRGLRDHAVDIAVMADDDKQPPRRAPPAANAGIDLPAAAS
jgi:hypothetical protein